MKIIYVEYGWLLINLELLVRSHEMKDEGYEVEADGRVITIFSAPNYCDQMRNKGAFIRFKGSDMQPKFTQFVAVVFSIIYHSNYYRSILRFHLWPTQDNSIALCEQNNKKIYNLH